MRISCREHFFQKMIHSSTWWVMMILKSFSPQMHLPMKGRTSLQRTMESTTRRSFKKRGKKMDSLKIRLIAISTYWNQWKQKATKIIFGLASMKGDIAMQHYWLHSSLLILIQQRMSSNISHWLQAISENNSFNITKKTPKRNTNAYGTSFSRRSTYLC